MRHFQGVDLSPAQSRATLSAHKYPPTAAPQTSPKYKENVLYFPVDYDGIHFGGFWGPPAGRSGQDWAAPGRSALLWAVLSRSGLAMGSFGLQVLAVTRFGLLLLELTGFLLS